MPTVSKRLKTTAFIAVLLCIVSLGYFLRTYHSYHSPLPYSPYDAFTAHGLNHLFDGALNIDRFTEKTYWYPTTYVVKLALGTWAEHLPIIYVAGLLVFFLFGKAVAGNALGGLLSMSLYAVSPENLLQYSNTVTASSICYLFSWLTLLFLYNYLVRNRERHLLYAAITGVLAVVSYHTGAVALVLVIVGIAAVQFAASDIVDKKFFTFVFGLLVFLGYWMVAFDITELSLINNAVQRITTEKDFTNFGILVGVVVVAYALRMLRFPRVIMPLGLLVGALLMVAPYNIFSRLLGIVSPYYYSSATTLNNYFAQAIITHVYVLILAPLLFKRDDQDKRTLFLRGWMIGLLGVFFALVLEGYYSRIFDYSFPFIFILFAWYWTQEHRWRIVIVPVTIVLLVASQIFIYRDPFSLRRYYQAREVESAKNIVNLSLPGLIFTDLRTAALLTHLGGQNVIFDAPYGSPFYTIFYNYDKVSDKVGWYVQRQGLTGPIYVLLSESMRTILYSTNIETKPLTDDTFNYYRSHYATVYDDGLMKVFKIYDDTASSTTR